MSEHTIETLAERWGVNSSTVRRWRLAGRLPEPITGPRQRGIRWSEESIKAFERAGFVSVADFKKDIGLIEAAKKDLKAIGNEKTLNLHVRKLAAAGYELLSNVHVPLAMRVQVVERILNQVNWSKALNMTDLDELKARRLRLEFLGTNEGFQR